MKPTALNIARAGAREGPSTSTLLFDLREFFSSAMCYFLPRLIGGHAHRRNRNQTNDLYNSAHPREIPPRRFLFARDAHRRTFLSSPGAPLAQMDRAQDS